MKFLYRSSSVSPHQAPLALELSKNYDAGDVVMYYTGKPADPFRATGVYNTVSHIAKHWDGAEEDERLYRFAENVLENHREYDRIEDRLSRSKSVFHTSERWFKPIRIPLLHITVPGFLKMIFPFAVKRALKIRALFRYDSFMYLPMGIHAARDMARVCGLLNGDLRCLFKSPELIYENKPGGAIHSVYGSDKRFCLDKMRMWGYFVAPSLGPRMFNHRNSKTQEPIKILWVGRFFRWKHVDDIIRAISGRMHFELHLYGAGPDEKRLRRLAAKSNNIYFNGLVPLAEVRCLMREFDVYVMASDCYEGWGAVVNEALEEGMAVIGTYEAGASATILQPSNLYHAGDWKALSRLLDKGVEKGEIGAWSVNNGARELCQMSK